MAGKSTDWRAFYRHIGEGASECLVRQTLNGLALVAMDLQQRTGVPGGRVRIPGCRLVVHLVRQPGMEGWPTVERRPEQVCVNGDAKAREPVFAEPVLILSFDRDNLTEIRTLVAAAADQAGLDAPRADALRVVVTELATNAVLHGGGSGVLRLWLGNGALHCRVSDEGPGLTDPDRAGTHLVPAASDEGRGLWLARQLSDDLSVVAGERGTTATASFHLP